MARPDHSERHSPRRRADTTHPAPTSPGKRRAVERRPWPTAPTATRVSPSKPTSGPARSRSRGSTSTPTPATVWTAGPYPIDLDTAWPTALVEKVVSSFSEPGAQVVLLAWPTAERNRPAPAPAALDRVIDSAPATEPDPELADAVHTVERLGRGVRVKHVPDEATATGPTSRPFWADLVDGRGPGPATGPTTPAVAPKVDTRHATEAVCGDASLVISSLRPHHSGARSADLVALFAARLLTVGGILVVLTQCDWTTGELTDPTGPVVSAGQNADLLYLQHIVAVHAPVRDGRFHLADAPSDHYTDADRGHADARDAQARGRHRAATRGLLEPHQRIHSDVLVFAQPHNHQPPTGTPSRAEDLR